MRRLAKLGAIVAVVLVVAGAVAAAVEYRRTRAIRQALYEAFTPQTIVNCELARYGSANDGGYLMCANLLSKAEAGYSYGVNGEDAWGCAVSNQFGVPMQQYGCGNTTAPVCAGGRGVFHAECVGPERTTIDGRPVDTIVGHLERNRHIGKRLVIKMDVEGAEWPSLLTVPEHVLEATDQLVVEFHGVETPAFLDTITRLKQYFYVAHYHQDNASCEPGFDPFPGQAFEVLFVNKRIAVTDPWVVAERSSPLDAPNTMTLPDCQSSPGGNGLQRGGRWMRRQWGDAMALLQRQ